jgi:hypothetical protein
MITVEIRTAPLSEYKTEALNRETAYGGGGGARLEWHGDSELSGRGRGNSLPPHVTQRPLLLHCGAAVTLQRTI